MQNRERYTVYLKKELMISLKKFCLDEGKKLSNVLEEIVLNHLTSRKKT